MDRETDEAERKRRAASLQKQIDDIVVGKRQQPRSLRDVVDDAMAEDRATAEQVGFERVRAILDRVFGDSGIGEQGAFWRTMTRDEFIRAKIFSLDLLVLGNGSESNLIKALKGEAPFGADLPTPPAGARFSRLPENRPPMPEEDITLIQQWIDARCPDG